MAAAAPGPLTAEETGRARLAVIAWRGDPERRVACPRCGQEGLSVIDRSARPYAEWYQLDCAHCGLSAALNIPLGAPVIGGMD